MAVAASPGPVVSPALVATGALSSEMPQAIAGPGGQGLGPYPGSRNALRVAQRPGWACNWRAAVLGYSSTLGTSCVGVSLAIRALISWCPAWMNE